jgi:flagellar protein FlbD
MIQLTRLNHLPLVVNADLIEHIEVTPDTVIALTTGQKFLVLETADEVIERVVRFRRSLFDRVAVYPFKTGTQAAESRLPETAAGNEQ